MKSELPIGVFDSGIGGLTVAREIIELMPNEKVIYFGDTLHLPYGEKSKEKVINYCSKICEFLLKQECKAIVIACNTASSLAIKNIEKEVGNKCLVFNVIDPVIEFVQNLKSKKIGIIGTNATIESNVYEKKMVGPNSISSIFSLATPLLAPMIESSFHDESIKKKIIATYLKNDNLQNIDTLILGCTHYPLIQDKINEFYNGKVNIISALDSIGLYIQNELKKKNFLNKKNYIKKHEFFISDFTNSFQKSAKSFFNKEINLKEIHIFNET